MSCGTPTGKVPSGWKRRCLPRYYWPTRHPLP
ncbi:MAG: hypothetical protein KDA79_03850 [Planctomycetaceae bacterium]|nr:hypothetical protein [Planctomycetaceae bacterium]